MKIKVNGDNWTIEIVNSKQMKRQREDGEHLAGLCVPSERSIYIAEDCIDLKTVTHEMYHSYFSYLYLDDTNDLQINDIEEICAAHFTDKAAEILKQSKSIYRQLMKGKR